MKVIGTVEDVIFANEENGYTVLTFATDDDFFTAVGVFPYVSPGERLELTGEFKKNNKFGEQFVVEEVKMSQPDDVEGILKYLASGLFKGIGEKLALQIVEKFGDKTLDILENKPERLREVSGIGRKKLMEILESYRDTKNMKDAIFFLQRYEVSTGLALKIYKEFGEATESVVTNNPYILVEKIDGVGFLTADRIADKMGVDRHSQFRIKAGILHALTEASARGGHTCYPREMLIESAAKIMNIDKEEVAEEIDNVLGIRRVESEGIDLVASEINYRTENAISVKLLTLRDGADEWDVDPERELTQYEKTCDITFHEQQREAIKSIFSSGVTVITGGPGTGKTTIIKAIVQIAEQHKKEVVLCAPTGRASKRMTEMTGTESKTIHRLLGVDFTSEGAFERSEKNPLTADVVIVDEISMADIFVFLGLLRAIPRGARLVLVGDKDQLPSVSCGNILADVISSKEINVVYLTEIYRQNEGYIVSNAHRVNRGLPPVTDNKSDFFISYKSDQTDIINTVVGMIKSRIPNFAHVSSYDIQVLTPVKKGIVGVDNLNVLLQQALNPDGAEYKYKNVVFRVGDKVMQTVNDYTIEWQRLDNGDVEFGTGVYNGDIGIITAVRNDRVEVMFDDGKQVTYTDSDLDELTLAYCVSVHKSQGSEFPVVVVALYGANYMIMTRNLLYTAITRAKKMVVIVGEEECIKKMVANDYTAKRYSLLKDFLKKNVDKVTNFWR